MNIKQAAERSGLSAKTIRYYEDIGLIEPARRDSGYRDFSEQDVSCLQFVGRARNLGFSTDVCRTLLGLYKDPSRASADVKAIARDHLSQIEQKIKELEGLRFTLTDLVDRCQGNSRPDCPIIDILAQKSQSKKLH